VPGGYDPSTGTCTPSEYSEALADEDELGITLSTGENSFIVDWVFLERFECSRGGDCVLKLVTVEPPTYGCGKYYLWDDYEELPAQYTELECTEENLGFDPDDLGY
jgi:hypothetical protein